MEELSEDRLQARLTGVEKIVHDLTMQLQNCEARIVNLEFEIREKSISSFTSSDTEDNNNKDLSH